MFYYKTDKDNKPHKYIGNGKYSTDIVKFQDILAVTKEEYTDHWLKYTTKDKNILKNNHDYSLKTSYYPGSVAADKDYPYEQAIDTIQSILDVIHKYKDYYFQFSAARVAFGLARSIIISKDPTANDYISDVLDIMIPFTKENLFEIYLVDRVAFQQIIRGFYWIYGFDFRYYGLPFLEYKRYADHLQGLLYWGNKRIYNNARTVDPFDPCPETLADEYYYLRRLKSFSPDMIILPTYYLYIADCKRKAGVSIKNIGIYNKYIPYIKTVENALYYNDDYNYPYIALALSKGPDEYKFNKKAVLKCLPSRRKGLPENETEKSPAVWYSLAYFLCETEGIYPMMVKAAEAALKNPKIKDYTIEDLNLMSKNPKREYSNKTLSSVPSISKIIAIILITPIVIVEAMFLITMIRISALTGDLKRALIVIGVIAFFMILGFIMNICDIDMSSGTNYSSGSSGGSDGSWFHPGSNMDNRQGYQSSWHDLYMFHHYGPKK